MKAAKVALVLVLCLVSLPGCGGRTQLGGPGPAADQINQIGATTDAAPDPGGPEPPMSACVSMVEHPTLSCTEVCATAGKICGGGCHVEATLISADIQVAYYSDQMRCERNDARYFALNDGRNFACSEAFTTADPFGEVTYARCCCGVGKVVQVLSEPP